jgi:hypothetical protein
MAYELNYRGMSFQVLHSILVSSLSLSFMVVVIHLAQKQKISFRYAAGWISLFGVGLLGGIVVPLVEPLADLLHLAPISIVVGSAVLALLAICVQLTVSISGLQHQVRQLAEKIALNDIETKKQQGSDSE